MCRAALQGGILLCLIALSLAALAQKKPPAKPIDINTASVEQLQQLPGVGPAIAKSIFDFRKKSGPFRRMEDLLAIRGISENRYRAIAPYIVVSPPKPAAAAKPGATAARPAVPPKPSTPAPSAAPKPNIAPKTTSPAK